jgi:hypothetical protein
MKSEREGEVEMKKAATSGKANNMHDMEVRLSMLWIFAMFNYLYADVCTLMDP